MKKIYFLLPLLLASLGSECQVTNKWQTNEQKNDVIMKQYITNLKEGALLVRLKTRENSVNALKQHGDIKAAIKLEQEQQTFNKQAVVAFHKNFTFCPVYFFYSNYSDTVRHRDFDHMVFLNDSLQPDNTIKIHPEKFLTAEFGEVEQDTAKYYDSNYLYNDEKGLSRKNAYYGSPNTGFSALVIMSDQFVQLQKPFPFYVRMYNDWPLRRKLETVIKMLDKKLSDFYVERKKHVTSNE